MAKGLTCLFRSVGIGLFENRNGFEPVRRQCFTPGKYLSGGGMTGAGLLLDVRECDRIRMSRLDGW